MSNTHDALKIALEKCMSRLMVASQAYDKAILSLSTATLGFTFAFVEFKQPKIEQFLCLLYFSWIFLIVAIVCILIAFITEQIYSSHETEYYLARLTNNKTKEDSHWVADAMFIFPILSGLFFAIALIFFTIFVAKNT